MQHNLRRSYQLYLVQCVDINSGAGVFYKYACGRRGNCGAGINTIVERGLSLCLTIRARKTKSAPQNI